ncbi:MAG: hypothetical protein KC438_11450, partial [Thermomicrobiales bacterium]|nr:hypothetical protein [Thermomicrobiales bacterium]
DRSAINQAAGLPLPNRELRAWVLADADAAGVDPPSLNRVRKELQRWVHQHVLEDVGVIEPGPGDIDRRIAEIRALVGAIAPLARGKTAAIVAQLGQLSDLANGRVEQIECDQQKVPQ